MKTSNNATTKIVLSNTYLSGFYHQIDEIKRKCNDGVENIILVVPDKFSLNAEQIFMERTGFSSVFNVWLTTLSRFVDKVTSEDLQNNTLLSKNSGTMLVSKIIQENIDKISTYKKIANNYELAKTMYNVINLLKSSGVTPSELKNNFNETNLGLKIKDIYLIYSEYEKCMKNSIDSITRLQIFDNKIKNSEYIKNSHIYFAMFDGFTNVQINSLAQLAKASKYFSISLCANTKQSNSYIYDNYIFQKFKNIFDENNIEYNIINKELNGTKIQKFISKNLFAINYENKNLNKNNEKNTKNIEKIAKSVKISNKNQKKALETDKVKLIECSNTQSEIRYVASKIKYLFMKNNYMFDDINIAVNGLNDYKLQIKQIFAEYDLPCYIDDDRTMLEHYFTSTFFKIADFVQGQKSLSNAIDIVMSPIYNLDGLSKNDFQNYCIKHNFSGEDFYNNFIDDKSDNYKNAEEIRQKVFKNIENFEKKLKNASNLTDLKNCLIEFLDIIDAKNIIDFNKQNQSNLLYKQIDSEVYDKFNKTLEECDSIVGNLEVNASMFFDMLKSCLEGVNLLSVPIKCDAIFVGDASKSTYYPRKILFVMGSTQNRMPSIQSDSGTLTDTEIALLKSNNNIRPTIKEINKREKFKLFNLITLPSDRLELTYANLINGQVEFKSDFIYAVQNIFTNNGLQLPVERYEYEDLKILDDTDSTSASFMVGTIKNAIKISKSSSENLKFLLNKQLTDVISSFENEYKDSENKYEINNIREKFFDNNKTKITQIERYFRCPFLQFIDYAVKPKDNPKFEIKNIDVGNILHNVAQLYVENYIKRGYLFAKDIDIEVEKLFNFVINKPEFKIFAKNIYAINNLKEEAKRFCKAITHQIECSDFKPIFAEKSFENFKLDNNLSIDGKVDRIDAFSLKNVENDLSTKYVRVIDYKTGKDKFGYADIYYGIKLQLIVYLNAICDELNAKPVSTGYIHVKNKFNDFFENEFKSYKIDGVTLQNDGMILRLDKNLLSNKKSEIINVDLTNDGYSKNCSKYLLTEKELKSLQVYALNILNNATTEMLSGYIEPKPYKNGDNTSCSNCKWKSVCHYNLNKTGYREILAKNKENF